MTFEYRYKTKPFDHQKDELIVHGEKPRRALFWEQGTGKTKPVIDTTVAAYDAGEVDALCVVAPNGVHRNWVSDELPAHMPEDVFDRTKCHIWYSTNTIKHKRSFNDMMKYTDGPKVFVISYNALLTEGGNKAWRAFLKGNKCMYVLDESQRIKNPNGKWSRRITSSKDVAIMKRILSGTPCDNSPFDLYNQFRFIESRIWKDIDLPDFGVFKQFFGIWETRRINERRKFEQCVAYRNLPLLHELMKTIGTRVTKDEVLDLPPKLYSKRHVELSPQQKRIYKRLKDDFILESAMEDIPVMLAIVRMLRFQQIICGYLPSDEEGGKTELIPGKNPRLDALCEICEDLPHKAIIWARFTKDIELISQHPVFAKRCTVVNGSVTGPKRGDALDSFQKGDVQFLIANPAAISTGVTLHSAKTVIYYSNTFKLGERLQSEDRAHRIGLLHPVHYIDLVADGTIDERIIDALRRKVNVSAVITGDTLKDWI